MIFRFQTQVFYKSHSTHVNIKCLSNQNSTDSMIKKGDKFYISENISNISNMNTNVPLIQA